MKNIFKTCAFIALGMLATACSDNDVNVGMIDESRYSIGEEGVIGSILDNQGRRVFSKVEFRDTATVVFNVHSSLAATADAVVTATYDASVLEAYNKSTGNKFEALPESELTLDGTMTLAKGQTVSAPLSIKLKSNGQQSHESTYAIPLRMKVTSGKGSLPTIDQTKIVFVKDLTALPSVKDKVTYDKEGKATEPVKVFSCMEVNDTNPLNNLCFTLKKTGAPLIDGVILFSSNINYNDKTGRVYLSHNENNTAIFSNRMKYLKPLKDRGMKVYLSVLGNHDRSGVANLSKETAQDFAREIKATCDAYDLDGVMLDDEYSNYGEAYGVPGFVNRSNAAIARLYYEIKRIMPDRDMIVYQYGSTPSGQTVDGVPAGEFIDYVLHDYGNSWDVTGDYPGMPFSHLGLYSQEYTGRYFSNAGALQSLVDQGSRAHMIFAMDPNRSNYYRQLQSMQAMARVFYQDELVVTKNKDGRFYQKDWVK
ncbi:BT_3987 domain-containing protein [Prevotella sp.]|uniref:BT_3987 domain-containing protein n=1 Tax=Prevotella sp. TaxID=59823 RepID=UPI002F92DEC5